jgi:hypothetical protein
MRDWVNDRLDQMDQDVTSEYILMSYSPDTRETVDLLRQRYIANDGPEKLAARNGDWTKLEAKYPTLRGWLKLPKKPRGKHKRPQIIGPADMAAIDVLRIRDIWRQEYEQVQRTPFDGPSALEIAAERHGVKIELIESKLKSRTKTTL